jgi:hypothetical protein
MRVGEKEVSFYYNKPADQENGWVFIPMSERIFMRRKGGQWVSDQENYMLCYHLATH